MERKLPHGGPILHCGFNRTGPHTPPCNLHADVRSKRRVSTRHAAVALCALTASDLAGGTFFGFGSLAEHLECWTLAAMLVAAALLVVRGLWPQAGSAETAIQVGLLAFAEVTVCGPVLGGAGCGG